MISDIFNKRFSFKDRNPQRNMIFMLFIALIPLIPVMFLNNLFKYTLADGTIEKGFFNYLASDNDIVVEGFCFLFTAGILFLADKVINGRKTIKDIKPKNAVTIGLFQCVALLPGVSRSGSTIAGGIFSGFTRKTAIQFSFLLGIPTVLGSMITELPKGAKEAAEQIGVTEMIIGFIVAAVVGIVAIKLVTYLLQSNKFKVFWMYTAILGVVTIVIGTFTPFGAGCI